MSVCLTFTHLPYVDIYGVSSKPIPSANNTSVPVAIKKTKTVIHLSLKDSIPGHGPITDMTFSLTRNGVRVQDLYLLHDLLHYQDRPVPELVTATGCSTTGGFTLFQVCNYSRYLNAIFSLTVCRLQRDLPVLTKRKMHVIGGARGLWSLPIRQQVKTSGISYEKAASLYHAENDSLILSTDINPSPGLSRVCFTFRHRSLIDIFRRRSLLRPLRQMLQLQPVFQALQLGQVLSSNAQRYYML